MNFFNILVAIFLFSGVVRSNQCGIYRLDDCAKATTENCLSSYTYLNRSFPVACELGIHNDCVPTKTQCSNICTCFLYAPKCEFRIPAKGCMPFCSRAQSDLGINYTLQCGTSVTICYTKMSCVNQDKY